MRNLSVRSDARADGGVGAGGVSVGVRAVTSALAIAAWIAAGASLVTVLSLGGCNRKDASPRPASIAPNPVAPGAPVAPVGPITPSAVRGPPPTEPPTPPPAAGAETATKTDPGKAGGAGATITGKISLATARKGDVTPNDVVYLVARRVPDNPSARGSLIAVKRFTASSFPIEFTLGAGDMMFKNGPFEGELTLAARVDKDGDPMSRRKGDVFGTIAKVKVGAAGVHIKLDQLQKEDESLAAPAAPGTPALPGGLPAGHP